MARDMACITTIPGKRGDSYRVQVWDPRAGKLHRKTFRMLAEARTWRDDVRAAVKHGTMRAASRTSLSEAARTLIAGMEAGIILDKSGRPYKPSTTRSYTRVLRTHVLPDLGAKTLQDIRRADLQDLVDRWRALGAQPSTARNRLDPVRVIYRRAVHRDEVAIEPDDRTRLAGRHGKPGADRVPRGGIGADRGAPAR